MSVNELAFVFPGQGSQKIGMLSELAAEHAVIQATFTEASEVLGYDLWDLTQNGSQDQLNMTEVTQPALLASSVALWRLWKELEGASPTLMAGHSLGEWSALVCSGVVGFGDAIGLVRLRGKYMQEAVPAGVGGMAAIIGLDDLSVEEICTEVSTESSAVSPVNYNSPGQLVIAGHKAAVENAIGRCKEAGAKRALPLPVSAPFHTQLMKPAADQLAIQIAGTEFSAPEVAIVHNVNASTEASPEAVKQLMIAQIYSPVRWVECVQSIAEKGVSTTVECGPGKVLSGLNKRIVKALNTYNLDSAAALEAGLAAFK